MILGTASVVDTPDTSASPGTVIGTDDGQLTLATGNGAVAIRKIQPAGKRMLDVSEFLRGYRIQPGERFGPE